MYSTQKEFPYSKEGWRKLVNVILEISFFLFFFFLHLQGQTLPYIMASKACFHFKSHLTARNKTHCHLFSLAIYTIYYYSRCRTPTIDAQGRAPSIIMYFFFLCATTKPPHYSNCICTTICITSVPRGEYQQKRAFFVADHHYSEEAQYSIHECS